MSQAEGYRVATGPHDWVTVKTAEDAVKLGKAFAVLVADLGVYKAERDRLTAENEQLNHKLGRLLGAESQWVLVEPNEYARLTSENERLRKAGDELEDDLFLRMNLNARLPSSIAAWNAAKEGRDAK